MIKSITVENWKGERLVMELSHPEKSGVNVRKVSNIGPGDANVNISEMASVDGGIFSSSRASSRTIQLELAPMFCPQIENGRHIIYKYFELKKKVRLIFETDERTSWIEGYVSKNKPEIFSKDETVKIDIICPYPFFKSDGRFGVVFSGAMPMFEFPFSNESLSDPLIEFGEVSINTDIRFVYDGDIETGFIIKAHCLANISEFIIFNILNEERMVIDDDMIKKIMETDEYSFKKGDDLVISTIAGDIYAKLIRDGKEYNVISALGRDVDWFQMVRGDNAYTFSAHDEDEKNIIIYFSYDNVHGGV